MKKGSVISTLLATGLLMVATCVTGQSKVDDYPPIVTTKDLVAKNDFRGKKAPQFEVENWFTASPPVTKGKVVLIDFWATWCGFCMPLIPELNKWAEKYKDDLVVIGLTDESIETVNGFLEKTEVNYPIATDTLARTKSAVGVTGIPYVLVISADGIVRWQGVPTLSEDKLTEEKLKQIIDASKKKKK